MPGVSGELFEDVTVKKIVRQLAIAGFSTLMVTPVLAKQTEIELWYSLSGANRQAFVSLIDRFNSQQSAVRVDLNHYNDPKDLIEDARKVVAGKGRKPDLVQLPDNRSPEVIAQHKDILPLYKLLAKYPISDASWFLEKTTEFVRDGQDRLLAFPMMAEVPVMFYNIDAYRGAGLDASRPAATWQELQGHLLKIRNEGRSPCPYGTSDQVKIHLENLAPLNNEFYVTPDNGLKSSRDLSFNFNTLYVRHLSLMVSWQKTELFVNHTSDNEATESFTNGQCAVLTAGSGALGQVMASNVQFGVAPVPFYNQVTKKPGAPFIGGSALWVVNGQPAANQKAVASLLAFLSKPVNAAEWHQKTGFMPLTDAAFRAADVSFYDRIPGARSIVEQMRNSKGPKAAGFNVPNYPKILPVFNDALDKALASQESPMSALMRAKQQAAKLMR